jgi:hypothetical protein
MAARPIWNVTHAFGKVAIRVLLSDGCRIEHCQSTAFRSADAPTTGQRKNQPWCGARHEG